MFLLCFDVCFMFLVFFFVSQAVLLLIAVLLLFLVTTSLTHRAFGFFGTKFICFFWGLKNLVVNCFSQNLDIAMFSVFLSTKVVFVCNIFFIIDYFVTKFFLPLKLRTSIFLSFLSHLHRNKAMLIHSVDKKLNPVLVHIVERQ